MGKKTFVRGCRLNKKGRWYLDFNIYHGESGEEIRKRMDFDLNEIEDLKVREQVAERLIKFLQTLDFEKILWTPTQRQGPTVREAIEQALARKSQSDRRNTNDTYSSTTGIFLRWATRHGHASKPFSAFQKNEAREFMDSLRKKKLAARTLNNYRNVLKTMWTEAADGDATAVNPWKAVKPLPEPEKTRRIFTEHERAVVASYIEETDYWLFRGVLLQYYCFIRPCELSRIRFKDFDMERGLVHIKWYEAKSKKEGWATIPQSVRHYFTDGIFNRQAPNHYLFGRVGDGRRSKDDRMAPSPTPARDDRAYKKHCKVLNHLLKTGQLKDIENLVWYSWKDTGISTHVHETSPIGTRDQARHTDFNTTLIYYHTQEVNAEYAALRHNLYSSKEHRGVKRTALPMANHEKATAY